MFEVFNVRTGQTVATTCSAEGAAACAAWHGSGFDWNVSGEGWV